MALVMRKLLETLEFRLHWIKWWCPVAIRFQTILHFTAITNDCAKCWVSAHIFKIVTMTIATIVGSIHWKRKSNGETSLFHIDLNFYFFFFAVFLWDLMYGGSLKDANASKWWTQHQRVVKALIQAENREYVCARFIFPRKRRKLQFSVMYTPSYLLL